MQKCIALPMSLSFKVYAQHIINLQEVETYTLIEICNYCITKLHKL